MYLRIDTDFKIVVPYGTRSYLYAMVFHQSFRPYIKIILVIQYIRDGRLETGTRILDSGNGGSIILVEKFEYPTVLGVFEDIYAPKSRYDSHTAPSPRIQNL